MEFIRNGSQPTLKGPPRSIPATSSGAHLVIVTGMSNADHRDDAHRYPGSTERKSRRVDGSGNRRAISARSKRRMKLSVANGDYK